MATLDPLIELQRPTAYRGDRLPDPVWPGLARGALLIWRERWQEVTGSQALFLAADRLVQALAAGIAAAEAGDLAAWTQAHAWMADARHDLRQAGAPALPQRRRRRRFKQYRIGRVAA